MAGQLFDDPNRECVGLAPIWGDDANDNVPGSTTATAGTPGTFGPAGSDVPDNAAQANAWGVRATPATAWTVGQYVQGETSGAAGEMFWNGTTWTAGRSPVVGGEAFDPGAHTVDEVKAYVEAYPADLDAVYAAEKAGKARTTLLDWLEAAG